MDLIDILGIFHPNAEEYTFFSRTRGIFFRIDHILGHKINLSKYKKIEIVSRIFSDHNALRLYINNYFKCKRIKCSNQKTQTG